MLKNILLTMLIALFGLSGCSSDSNTPLIIDQNGSESSVPDIQKVTKLKVLDAAGSKLPENTNVDVSTVDSSSQSSSLSKKSISLSPVNVDSDGFITLDNLGAGIYKLTITIGDKTIVTFLEIPEENFQEAVSAMVPAIVSDDGSVDIINDAIVASISGTVYDVNGIGIDNAQVTVSGGAMTNGAFATAYTDQNGFYELIINTSKDNILALLQATITASADGYNMNSITYSIKDKSNKSGVNFNLSLNQSEDITALYTEDFEGDTDGWTINKLTGDNLDNTWNLHVQDLNITNKSYINDLVYLAPNDSTDGKIPNPINGTKCFWYGNPDNSNESTGSFIDVATSNDHNGSGGTSESYANSAELISPAIDLTQYSGAINVSFKTWWEIESVNPNANGYDLMTISASDNNGTTWRDLARLNPLSDPQSANLDRSPIPFSNTGFNSAPNWQTVEGIALVDSNGNTLAGKTIKLKYTFDSKDNLYNGFRGWMIDDLKISTGEGTYPLLSETGGYDIYDDIPESGFFVENISPSSYSTSGFVPLTLNELQTFAVNVIYTADTNVTFSLQLKDALTDEVVVDDFAVNEMEAASSSTYAYDKLETANKSYAASSFKSTRNNTKATSFKSISIGNIYSKSIKLEDSITIPETASGSVSLWVIMKETSSGEEIMSYPIEFYELSQAI